MDRFDIDIVGVAEIVGRRRAEHDEAAATITGREMDEAPAIEFRKPTKLAVSVVIPVYNERDTVVEVVRRVQAVGIHEEIIIVDDFSIDGTRQILMELDREEDIRVLLLRGGPCHILAGLAAPDRPVA